MVFFLVIMPFNNANKAKKKKMRGSGILTLYLMLSLRLLKESFFRLRVWKPAWMSLTNRDILMGRS